MKSTAENCLNETQESKRDISYYYFMCNFYKNEKA